MEEPVECAEVSGKTVKVLKLYESEHEGYELLIEFTDGTSFSCCLETRHSIKASLFRGGIGTPHVVRDYAI
jgi:hypothetical protein